MTRRGRGLIESGIESYYTIWSYIVNYLTMWSYIKITTQFGLTVWRAVHATQRALFFWDIFFLLDPDLGISFFFQIMSMKITTQMLPYYYKDQIVLWF